MTREKVATYVTAEISVRTTATVRKTVVSQPRKAENQRQAWPDGAANPGVRKATQRIAEQMKMFWARAFLFPSVSAPTTRPAVPRGTGEG